MRSRWLDIAQVLFSRVYGPDGIEIHKHTKKKKKERRQYPATLTAVAWSIKDLLLGFRGNFYRGMWRVVPSGQDSSILPARVANHSSRFALSCPFTELAI